MSYSDEDLIKIPRDEFPKKSRSCTIPVGYYPSVISILEQIRNTFQEILIPIKTPQGTQLEPLDFVCNLKRNGFIECYARNFILVTVPPGPWSLLELDLQNSITNENLFYFNRGSKSFIQNRCFAKDLEPSFMYVNIIENSFVKSKRARVLSVIPIRMKADWSYFEFLNIKFVPIDVSEFSKITIEIKDKNGNFVKFNPIFSTIITLQIEPIIL